MDALGRLGRTVIVKVSASAYALGFFGRLLKETVLFFKRGQAGYRVLIMQVLFTGVEALGVSALLALGIGATVNFVGSTLLPQFGQGKLAYLILITIVTRELGPLLTAFIIVARSGTAIATEIGGMVVSHEIEAYVSVGIDPISYLAVPRFLGVTLSSVLLNIYFNLFGLLGSYAVLRFLSPLPIREYLAGLMEALRMTDLATGLLKSLVFGVLVSVIATYQGFSVERASTEVPQAGIRAVGQSFSAIILADAAITAISYIV